MSTRKVQLIDNISDIILEGRKLYSFLQKPIRDIDISTFQTPFQDHFSTLRTRMVCTRHYSTWALKNPGKDFPKHIGMPIFCSELLQFSPQLAMLTKKELWRIEWQLTFSAEWAQGSRTKSLSRVVFDKSFDEQFVYMLSMLQQICPAAREEGTGINKMIVSIGQLLRPEERRLYPCFRILDKESEPNAPSS